MRQLKKIENLMKQKLLECIVGIDFVLLFDNQLLGTTAHLKRVKDPKTLLLRQAEGVAKYNGLIKEPDELVWLGNQRCLRIVPFKKLMISDNH